MIQANLAPDGASLLVRFPYHEGLIAQLRTFPGRRFSRPLGGWLLPLSAELLKELPLRLGQPVTIAPEVHGKLAALAQAADLTKAIKASAPGAGELPADVEWSKAAPPFDHHKTGLALFINRPTFAFFWDMGTMKTYLSLSGMRWLQLRGALGPSLVIAPASVLHVWEDQAARFYPTIKIEALTGTVEQRREAIRTATLRGVEVLAINPEALWRLLPDLQKLPLKCLIVDESHRFKHRSTNQAKALLKLARTVPRRYLLSGTPAPNSPLEYWAQFAVLDPTILGSSFYAFRDRYAVLGGYQGKQVVAYHHLEELTQLLRGHSHRVTKAECLDLPAKVYETVRLDLEGDQRIAYDQMAKHLVAEVRGQTVTASVLVAKLTKLRELLAGFVYDETGKAHHLKENAKRAWLMDWLEDVPKDAKVVIWGHFRPELDWVEDVLKKRGDGYVRLDGSTPIPARKTINDRFQQEHEVRVFLGQQQSGGLGIDLTAGSYCTFLTNDFGPDVRLQAEDRLHRQGQRNVVTYYDPVCKGTVDVAVRAALKRKQKLSDQLSSESFGIVATGAEAGQDPT